MAECSITLHPLHPLVALLELSLEHWFFFVVFFFLFLAKTLLFPKIRCSTAASPALDAEFELLLSHLFIMSGVSEAGLGTCPVLGLLGAETQLYY